MYDWGEKTKLYLAVCKLRGNAKLWHDGLAAAILTWEAFSIALIKQFSGKVSFGELLKEAANYSSSPGQDLQAYCYVTFEKLNQFKLDVSETQIINCIAQGIQDEGISRTVLTARFQTLTELIAGTFTAAPIKPKEGGGGHRSWREPLGGNKRPREVGACYNCRKPGHKKSECYQPIQSAVEKPNSSRSARQDRPRCDFCGISGHSAERCYKKNKGSAKPL